MKLCYIISVSAYAASVFVSASSTTLFSGMISSTSSCVSGSVRVSSDIAPSSLSDTALSVSSDVTLLVSSLLHVSSNAVSSSEFGNIPPSF